MTIKIESPYEETPYQLLSHPEFGPFPTNGSCVEARKRLGDLRRKRMASRAKAASSAQLSSPAKRIQWDIFCAPLPKEAQPASSKMVAGAELSFGPEFVVWRSGPHPNPSAARIMGGPHPRPLSHYSRSGGAGGGGGQACP